MCTYHNYSTESHNFTKSILHPLVFIEVPIHFLGGYIIVFKTPAKMASIKLSMLGLHLWSAILDIQITSLTTPFFIFPYAAGSFTGILSYFGFSIPFQMFMFISAISATVVSILALFENRYNTLKYNKKRSETFRVLHILANYILAFTFMIPPLVNVPEQEHAVTRIKKEMPCLPPEVFGDGFFVIASDSFLIAYSSALFAATCCIQIFYFFFQILGLLANKEHVSENTYKIQRKFYTALSIQLSIPMIFLLTPVLYMLFSFTSGYFDQSLNNLLFVTIAFHGFVSTCVMLSVHGPYRESVLKLICFWKKEDTCHDKTKRMSLVVSL